MLDYQYFYRNATFYIHKPCTLTIYKFEEKRSCQVYQTPNRIGRNLFPLYKELTFAYNIMQTNVLEADGMQIRIGQIVDIVYMDKSGKITQRKIEVLGIRDGRIRAICLTTGAPRVFIVANILAWQPVKEKRHA